MLEKFKLSNEESFIVTTLFKNESFKRTKLNKINFEKLVKIASSHLILPTLYNRLLLKKELDTIPNELQLYLKEIYEINRNRNEILLNEINEINEIFYKNNIDFVFLKGAANISCNLYNDIGERMVGDIDLLVNKNDIQKSMKIVKDYGFQDNLESFGEGRHLKRQISEKKIFAIEIHRYLLRKNINFINTDEILDKKIYYDRIPIPNLNFQINHNIYSHQINDFGNVYLSYSYRNIYDTILLLKRKNTFNEYNFKENKIKSNYFMILGQLKVMNFKIIKFDNFDKLKFRFKYQNKIFFLIFNFLAEFKKIRYYLGKFKKLFKNHNYRKYYLKKFK